MKWSKTSRWFAFVVMAAGLLIFISAAYGKRTQPSLAVEPAQELQQRVESLEQQVKSMQKEIKEMGKSLANKMDTPKEKPPGGWDKN